MTTEQNAPPQAPQVDSPEVPAQPGQGQSQGHRRRRRRRKGKQAPAANGQANGQGQQPQAQPAPQPQPGNQNQQGQKSRPSSQNRFFQKGNGQQQGGGGRRKSRQRKQQVFVGPMDHSYRGSNGNVADSSHSSMDFRNGNSNVNGNEAHAVWDHAVPVREDAPTRIYFFIEDLFFLAKIQETARKLGIKVAFVKADKDVVAKLAEAPEQERPSLIVFDLNNVNAKPLTLIPKIKSKLKKGTSVIGFLSHLQGDLKAKAIEAGCDMVMPRSAFSQNLPNLMRRHGLEEQEEEFETMQA
jgi:hypothetical protein